MISILVAEHMPFVRRGLIASLDAEPDLKVVADVGSGEDILPAALECAPDAAVIDVDLPGVDGLTAAAGLLEKAPDCRVMILSSRPRPVQVRRVLSQGILGFMSLDVAPDQLADGVRQICAGRRVLDSDLAVAAIEAAENPLTPRELDVLRLAAAGARSAEIAERLGLSTGTVRNHLTRILAKTAAVNRADAIGAATDAGWI